MPIMGVSASVPYDPIIFEEFSRVLGAKDMEKIDMDYFIEKAPIGFKSSNFTKRRVEKDFFEILPDAKL